MTLVEHARRELELIGEEPWIIDRYLAIVEAFAAMGHTGATAEIAANVVNELIRYRPLSPLTADPAEWIDRTEISGTPMWQNARDGRAISTDGGKTYTIVEDKDRTIHTSSPSRSAAGS